jgi:hypothetical protein
MHTASAKYFLRILIFAFFGFPAASLCEGKILLFPVFSGHATWQFARIRLFL